MIKYVVQNKLTKAFRIAFRITYFSYLSEEKKYLKEKYNFCASAYEVGMFVIIDEETGHHFVASEQGFNRCYSVITSIPMHPGIPSMKPSDDFKSEIDKRREIFSENVYDWPRNEMAKPVYVNTDIPSLYPHIDVYNMDKTSMHPNLFREFSLWQTKDAPWSPFTHLDIREMKKEKDTMTTKSKTINFCVKKVIFNGPATIVIWGDGTKTVVKCADSDSYSEWAGFAMCIAKRLYGEDFHHQFRHFCGVENDIPKKNTTGDGASIFEAFENLGKSACGCAESLSKALEGYSKVSDYRDVVFKDTFETGLVLKNMRNIVDALGFVSVADCCHMVGAMIHVGDHDIGWTDISKAMIIPVSNGYLIKYPEPASRDQSDRVEKEPLFQLRKVYYGSHTEARKAREILQGVIRANGYATVADYYSISNVNVAPEELKNARKYGWRDIGVANVGLCGLDKFKLDIPEPKWLNMNWPNEAKGLD